MDPTLGIAPTAQLAQLTLALERWPLAQWLRESVWVYPALNALHIVAIALLLGATVILDARLLGFAAPVPLAHVARAAWPFAAGGVALALATGPLLFIVQPAEYLANPAFFWKFVLLGAALTNVAIFHLSFPGVLRGERPVSAGVKAVAALSLVLWLAVLFAGRLIAFV
jgi:hypothetical protein